MQTTQPALRILKLLHQAYHGCRDAAQAPTKLSSERATGHRHGNSRGLGANALKWKQGSRLPVIDTKMRARFLHLIAWEKFVGSFEEVLCSIQAV
jgi:hypothetical protein